MRVLGEQILKKLNDAGYQAYFAGGCVRDEVLGVVPKDYDITTSARPEDVEALFEHTVPTGKAYGTITVMVEQVPFEVTTFRLESDYDGRRPKAVTFGVDLEQDLARRDFTMNAMAIGLEGVLIDPYGGQQDLRSGVIRFVGDPNERIREDRLRALRYVRFMCNYHLTGDLTCLSNVDLTGLSFERVRDEFNKILIGQDVRSGLQILVEAGLLKQFVPEMMNMVGFEQHNPNHSEDVFEHTLTVATAVPPVLELRLAAVFHDMGKPATFTQDELGVGHFYGHQKVSVELAQQVMTRLRYSRKQIETVVVLVQHHMRTYDHVTEVAAKRLIQNVGEENLASLFDLQRADTAACLGDRQLHLEAIHAMALMCQQVLEQKMPLKVTDLALNGHQLMAMGLKGREIGTMQQFLLNEVVEDKLLNTLEALQNRVRESLSSRT